MRENNGPFAWLRTVVSFISLLGILALTACGGGSGAPNNPFAPQGPEVVQPLTVTPDSLTVYSKVASSLGVAGGSPPYRAFSSNTLVLPVAQTVSGNTVPLLASPVTSGQNVQITIQDSKGNSAQAQVSVQPEPSTIPPDLVVLPAVLDVYPGVPTQISVTGGTSPYRAFSSNPTVLPVTLNVTGNAIPLLVATPPAVDTRVTLTVQDAMGLTQTVDVTVHATSVTPPPALTALPSALDITVGAPAQVSISGGTAPYRAFSSNPAVLPVAASIGGTTLSLAANDVGSDTAVTITILDTANQTAIVRVTVHPRPSTPPPTLVVLPSSVDLFVGVPVQLTISSGTPPYRAFSSNPAVLPVAATVTGNTVPLAANDVTTNTAVTVTIQDAAGQTTPVQVTVHPRQNIPLTVLPTSLDLFVGVPSQITVASGLAPYRAFSNNPGVLPVTQAVTGNTIPLVANDVATDTIVTITVQDAANLTVPVTVTVHPRQTTALSILPSEITIFAGVASQVQIIGGTMPYRAFSSNAAILPVSQAVNGNTVPLLASDVSANVDVTLTITDAANQTRTATVHVLPRPTTPPPALVVLPTRVDAYSGIATQISVSGGVTPYRVFSSNSAVLPVTESVTGNIIPLLAGTVTADTPVVLTVQDAAGQVVTVNVTVHPKPTTTPTPVTVIPAALDVTSGIAATLNVSGGAPPYRAFSSNSAVLPVAQDVNGNTVTLLAAPVDLHCTIVVGVPICADPPPVVNITVQDSIGQTATAAVTVHPQNVQAPPTLSILPDTIELLPGVTSSLAISGGVSPYKAFSSNPAVLPVAMNVAGNSVTLVAANVAADTKVVVTIQDAAGQTVAANVTVHPTPTTPGTPLAVIPTTLDAYSGVPTQVAIDGGQPPYRVFSSNTTVLPVTDPVGNIVPLMPGNVTTNTAVTLTVRDAVGAAATVNVTVHPQPTTPPPALVVLPTSLDVFSGVATQLTVSGGAAPYRAFSSNPAIVTVAQTVIGNVVPIVAGNVDANTSLTITIQDSAGQVVPVAVTVHPRPATPPPALSVLPSSADIFSGVASTLTVNGGIGPYKAFSSNSAVLPVAQIVTGNTIALLAAPVGANTPVTVTVQDAVGQTVPVVVTVHPQGTSPPPALVVLPDNLDAYPGVPVTLSVSGGVAPYHAFTSNSAVLPVSSTVSGNTVSLVAAAVAAETRVVVTIQDTAGQTATANVTVHPTPATPPPTLVVLPNNVTVTKGVPVTLTISGGLAPYKAYSSNPAALPVTLNVTGNSVVLIAQGVSADTNVVVTLQDSAGQTVPVTVLVKADSATPPPTLQILPATTIVFSGSPASLTVTGGTPPYQAFSSNPVVLPVAQTVTGSTIPLLASNVTADTAVTISVLDSDNKTATATVTVRASTLLNSITVTPNLPDCGTTAVCSGQTAVAAVTVSAPGGSGIPNRQIRFDVVTGGYGIVSGSGTVPTLTVNSDAAGSAKVVLMANVNAPTQVALIRATDLTTGQQVTSSFVIAQLTNGAELLSVLPESIALVGPDDTHCSNNVPVSYYIFGGTPPYRVVASLPTFVSMPTSPIIVTQNGGGFTVITNGSCFTEETFVITDATNRTITATLSSALGGAAGGGGGTGGGPNCSFNISPPDPQCVPVATPPSLTLTTCTEQVSSVISPANQTYTCTVPVGSPITTIGSAANLCRVNRVPGPAPASTTINVVVTSATTGIAINVPVALTGAAAGACP